MATTIEFTFPFAADWESCESRSTHNVIWKPCKSTPGKLKISDSRDYRVTANAATKSGDLAEMLKASTTCNIRTIRLPHGGAIGKAEFGQALAQFKPVEMVRLDSPGKSTGWLVVVRHAFTQFSQFRLLGWPIEDVTEAVGQIKAHELGVRLSDENHGFLFGNLFDIGGVRVVVVVHPQHEKQQLDWTGLSKLTGLQELQASYGFLGESFWSELGKLKSLPLLELSWPEQATAKAGSLKRLTSLKKLKISCLFCDVPQAFQVLSECPALDDVVIEQAKIDNVSAQAIGAMTALKSCHIHNAQMTDAGMKAMCRWPAIRSLYLAESSVAGGNTKPITTGFEDLGNLGTLDTLTLQGYEHVPKARWKCLQKLTKLKSLYLFSSPPFDLLQAIGPIPSLQELKVRNCQSLSAAGMAIVQALPQLTTLNLYAYRYRPYYTTLDQIGTMQRLKHLKLEDFHLLTDAQLGRIAGLGNLESLQLIEADKIGDRGILQLTGLTSLRLLSLEKLPKLTDKTIVGLSMFPKLESLSVRCNTKITATAYESLTKVRNLTTLHLGYARNLTGECLVKLAEQLPLTELLIYGCPNLTEEHWQALTKHPTLKRVGFNECKELGADVGERMKAVRPDWGRPYRFV